ncbi:MAG: CapA family protein [Bacteroidaceae bacterium]
MYKMCFRKRWWSSVLFCSLFTFCEAQQKIDLLFVGDLMQHDSQIAAAKNNNSYNYDECFQYVKDEISAADVAIGNLEVTLGGKPYRGYPAFSAPDEYLQAIQRAGFDVLLTANNHCLDRGKKGLLRTLKQLDKCQLPHLGTYSDSLSKTKTYPLLLEKNGFRIVFLAYTYATNGISVTPPTLVNYIDKKKMHRDITKAKAMQPDVIIACMHWGDEYHLKQNREQEALADWLIAEGVTHVIGSHPHVVQPIEVRPSRYYADSHVVAYSLGNFISGMKKRTTRGGLMVKMTLKKHFTYTRLDTCSYSLVYVSHPNAKRKNYVLLPVRTAIHHLAPLEAKRLILFKKGISSVFREESLQ